MSMYISSICVVLFPKESSLGIKSITLDLDCTSGCTISHAVSYVLKNPIVKSVLSKYLIVGLNFKYSEL